MTDGSLDELRGYFAGSVAFRPLVAWPHEDTPADQRRNRWTFRAGWRDTLRLLLAELRHLQADDLVIGCGLRERDVRQDGWPRADARAPLFPGVEISFTSDRLLDPQARRGRELIRRHGGERQAMAATHPDQGGDVEDFVAIQRALAAGRQVFATDACELWQHNVRSIALGLEALRAVDRYGITRRGQQYAGFRAALTTGGAG